MLHETARRSSRSARTAEATAVRSASASSASGAPTRTASSPRRTSPGGRDASTLARTSEPAGSLISTRISGGDATEEPVLTQRKDQTSVVSLSARRPFTLNEMEPRATSTVETLADEIAGLVVERQRLRAGGAGRETLEANRRSLAAAQNLLSQLLIERHLPRQSGAA